MKTSTTAQWMMLIGVLAASLGQGCATDPAASPVAEETPAASGEESRVVEPHAGELSAEGSSLPPVTTEAAAVSSAPAVDPGLAGAPTRAKTLTAITVQRHAGALTIGLKGDGDLSYEVLPLAGHRLVVDLAEVSNGTKRRSMVVGHPLLKQIRIGSHVRPRQKVRLVLDLTRSVPYTVEKIDGEIRVTLTRQGMPVKSQEARSPVTENKRTERESEPANKTVLSEGRPTGRTQPVNFPRFTGRRISLDFQDAELTSVLRLISDVSELNMVVGEAVKGKVTLKLLNVPWDQALDLILKMNQLGQIRDGNIIWIDTLANIARQQDEAAKAKEAMVKAEPLVTRILYLNYADAAKAVDIAKSNLSPRGEIKTDPRTNSMIVRDIESNMDKVAGIVRDLDQKTPQVQIEARIVQASKSFARGLGVNWFADTIPIGGKGGGLTLGTFPRGKGETFTISSLDTQTWFVDLPATAAGVSVPTSAVGLSLMVGKFLGTRSFLDLRLSAGESLGLTKLVSAPKIITLDNKPAKIEQGSQVPFQTTSLQGTQTTFVDATLTLNVTPHVIPFDNAVRLEIKATKNSIGPSVSTAGPTIDKKEATTEVLLRSGETTVLGGIFEESQIDNTQGIPWFNRIPFLKWLFKNEGVARNQTELLVFVTPTILKD